MTSDNLRLTLLLISFVISSGVFASNNGQICIDSNEVSVCRELATRLSADKKRLQNLATTLETAGHHEAATAVYETAAKFYPQDRKLLQGLIRARSNLRSLRLIDRSSIYSSTSESVGVSNDAARTSQCWTLQWFDALSACEAERRANPKDAGLQERTGDVLRSIGDVSKALRAYDEALRLSPANEQLQRKRRSLAQLTTAETLHTENSQLIEDRSASVASQNANDSSVVVRLELLETLRARALIDDNEYQERRARVLGSVFSATNTSRPTPPASTRRVSDVSKFGRYKALVIGNNSYGKFQALKTPIGDAKAIGELLRNQYGFDVTILLDANRYQIARALSKLRQDTESADNVLIYYAGHGYLDETTKRGYWLPVDAEPDNSANWISTSDVTDTLAGIAARHALVIADSCFSGSLLRSASANLDDRAAQIDRLFQKRSRTVMTSGGLEPVLDNGRGVGRANHSVFAKALLDALGSNHDLLEVSRLFVGLRATVTSTAEQTPQFAPIRNAGHEGGEFIFVPRHLP